MTFGTTPVRAVLVGGGGGVVVRGRSDALAVTVAVTVGWLAGVPPAHPATSSRTPNHAIRIGLHLNPRDYAERPEFDRDTRLVLFGRRERVEDQDMTAQQVVRRW